MKRTMSRIERYAKGAKEWHDVKRKRLLRYLSGETRSVAIPFMDEAIAEEEIPEFEETQQTDENANSDFWVKGKKYKKGQRRKYINSDFIDWVASAAEITLDGSCLNITNRVGEWGGLDIFYRKLGMRPGGKYRVSVRFKHNRETKYNGANGEQYVALYICCGKSYARGGVFTTWYSDPYSRAFSTGDTPAGEFEEVSCDIDFTGMEKIPGFARIQTAPTFDGEPPCDISLDYIKVEDVAAGIVIYYNDFDYSTYEAKGNITSETPPPESGADWEESGGK